MVGNVAVGYSEKLTCQLLLLTELFGGAIGYSEECGHKSSSPPRTGSSGVYFGGTSTDGWWAKFVWKQASLTGTVWGSVGCNEEDRNIPAVLVGGAHACTLDGRAGKPCGSAVVKAVFGGRDVGFVTTPAIPVDAVAREPAETNKTRCCRGGCAGAVLEDRFSLT